MLLTQRRSKQQEQGTHAASAEPSFREPDDRHSVCTCHFRSASENAIHIIQTLGYCFKMLK